MMMKKLWLLPFVALMMSLWASCGKDVTERQHVEEAVLASYDMLLNGRYTEYASMLAGASARNDDYNAQLADNAAMFIEEQRRLHTNIVDVRVADVKIGKGNKTADAYVVICYADSTNEEIVMPMLKEQGVWKVK